MAFGCSAYLTLGSGILRTSSSEVAFKSVLCDYVHMLMGIKRECFFKWDMAKMVKENTLVVVKTYEALYKYNLNC